MNSIQYILATTKVSSFLKVGNNCASDCTRLRRGRRGHAKVVMHTIASMASKQPLHSALKLEKSAISIVQKHIICIFKNDKKSLFAPEKSLKLPKMQF